MDIKSLINQAQKFLFHDLWSINLDTLSPKFKKMFHYLRVVMLTVRGFTENNVQTKASALTYLTVFALVPMLALVFFIAQALGLEQVLQNAITENFKEQQDIMNVLIDVSHNLLDNMHNGIAAIIGVGVIFWAVVKMLMNIEEQINDIWQIKTQRTLVRKVTDYLAILIIVPILLLASSALNVYFSSAVNDMINNYSLAKVASPVLQNLIKLSPMVIMWVLFTFIYIAIPNTKVSFLPGLIAGIIAGTAFMVTEWAYITLQVGAARYNAIYGSFAAIPLLLMWLQLSWLILLFGAELSFASQNIEMYEYEHETENMSLVSRKVMLIVVLNHIIKQFKNGEQPQTCKQMSSMLHIPQRLLLSLIQQLTQCKLINEVLIDESRQEIGYCPSTDTSKYTLKYVEEIIDNHGENIELPIDNLNIIRNKYTEKIAIYRNQSADVLIGEM